MICRFTTNFLPDGWTSRITSDTREFGKLVVLVTDLIAQLAQAVILGIILSKIEIRLFLYVLGFCPCSVCDFPGLPQAGPESYPRRNASDGKSQCHDQRKRSVELLLPKISARNRPFSMIFTRQIKNLIK